MPSRSTNEANGEAGDEPLSLNLLETYRQVPIYHLAYQTPTVLDRKRQEAELSALSALPDPRFGLIVNYQNLSVSTAYPTREQVEVQQSPAMQALRPRLITVARYAPGSLTSLVRTMMVHVYAQRGLGAGFVPDLDSALRAARRRIDRVLEEDLEGEKQASAVGQV